MDALEFNVSTLLRQDVGASAIQTVEAAKLDLDGSVARGLAGDLRLTRTNFGILARARLKAIVEVECDRCLERFNKPVEVDFSEEYLPVVDVATGRPVQSQRADETFFVSPNHMVDLTEATRQHILLAVPMHRVCREDCRGLCPTCGVSLNVATCNCRVEDNTPLSALAALFTESRPDA